MKITTEVRVIVEQNNRHISEHARKRVDTGWGDNTAFVQRKVEHEIEASVDYITAEIVAAYGEQVPR